MDNLLILTDWFTPGYKAGGPIRSCLNLATAMADSFKVFVLTANTDAGETIPYPEIIFDEWMNFEGSFQVKYLSKSQQSVQDIGEAIKEVNPDIIYLNSMFSLVFTIYPLWLFYRKKINPSRIILTPRGMLHKGALQYKATKKKLFLFLLRQSRISQKIFFQATDLQEQLDISTHLKVEANRITCLENLPTIGPPPSQAPLLKREKSVKLVFISRVAAKKNLDFLLTCLKDIPEDIQLELAIYGPIESEEYWHNCLMIIDELPSSVLVSYKGSLHHEEVRPTLRKAHFFMLLTHGENFGHAIFEAFAAGVPVIISDQTPWQELQKKGIGWDLPLGNKQIITNIIEEAAHLNQSEYNSMSRAAREFAENYVRKKDLVNRYLKLLTS